MKPEEAIQIKEAEYNTLNDPKFAKFEKETGTKKDDPEWLSKYYRWIPQEIKREDLLKRMEAEKKMRLSLLTITNYLENVELFYKENPFFFDRKKIFWMWNKRESCYEMVDDTDLLNLIEQELGMNGLTVTSKTKQNYLEAFRRVGRLHIPKEPPKTWVQFKNKIVDLQTGEEYEVSSAYFFCNPIPHNLGESSDTPELDKLFTEWVGDRKDILYEIIAYSCLRDYPIHVLFALIGPGRNGKSKFLAVQENFVGLRNVVSTELDDLMDNRFEKAKLYKKLLCTMGETNFATMTKSSILKKLTGQDLIGYEFKGKDPFDDYNYAKIIISSNSLPSSLDTSEGFYRRWIIIDFDKTFKEGQDVLKRIPYVEYENLCRKSIIILKTLLDRGSFTGQGTIEERKANYIKASNPLIYFIQDHCELGEDYFVKSKDLYASFAKYLLNHKKRLVRKKEFTQILSEEGYAPELCDKKLSDGSWYKTYWVLGLRLKVSAESDNSAVFSTPYAIERDGVGNHTENTENFRETDLHSFEHLQNIILDRPGQEIPAVTLISYGFTEEQLDKWKGEGLLYEIRGGVIKLV